MDPVQDYSKHWDDKFQQRPWGKYPPEDLVRFMARSFRNQDPRTIKVLEIGCGTGANVWYLHREGFQVAAIDGAANGVRLAKQRIQESGANTTTIDWQVGDFQRLPWTDQCFDVVIDIFALYANPLAVIKQTVSEVQRVLKPGGKFYSKLWGKGCTGYGTGEEFEPNGFRHITSGPCADMGVAHYFDMQTARTLFASFEVLAIDRITRTDSFYDFESEELLCQLQKPR